MLRSRRMRDGEDREQIVQPDQPGEVIEGDDEIPRQRPGEQRAFAWMRLAWIAIFIGAAVVLYAALR